MYIDSPDKILSFGWPGIDSPDIPSCLDPMDHVSPNTSASRPLSGFDSPNNVSSPDEQSEHSPCSFFCLSELNLLAILDFNSMNDTRGGLSTGQLLTFHVSGPQKEAFVIEFTSWFTIDRQSRSTSRLRMATGLCAVLSGMSAFAWYPSIKNPVFQLFYQFLHDNSCYAHRFIQQRYTTDT